MTNNQSLHYKINFVISVQIRSKTKRKNVMYLNNNITIMFYYICYTIMYTIFSLLTSTSKLNITKTVELFILWCLSFGYCKAFVISLNHYI